MIRSKTILAPICLAAPFVLLCGLPLPASVVRVEVMRTERLAAGLPMGETGPYERIVAGVHFAVDPKAPANRIISDIDFGPLNADEKVEFSADLCVLKPANPELGNGTVLFEVANRGGHGNPGTFSKPLPAGDPNARGEFGDGFVFAQGFTVVWLGWQADLPAGGRLVRLYAPVARDSSRPITGPVRSEFVPDVRALSFSLGDRTMTAYPVLNPDDPTIQLTVRDRVEGRRRVIPRSRWQFAREENGKPVPDRTSVFMASGFEPGRIYEVVYKAQDPVLAGLGPAAVRDLISFLKYGSPVAAGGPLGDQCRFLKRAIGFGSSQSGRFLRTFLYYGFNQDEENRQVFDGVWAHVAGAGRGSFNQRFAQPSRDGQTFMNLFYPTDIFPFSDLDQTDPRTHQTGGILTRATKARVVPKIFYTNSSHEYWGRAASLTHTTPDGKADFAPPESTRIYLISGTQHGPSPFPPPRDGRRYSANPVEYRWAMRALLVAFQKWLAEGIEPPPSQYPKVADGTLVLPESLKFPKIPGVELSTRVHKAYQVDYGPEFYTKGITALEPPRVGKAFSLLVPQVDADGNDRAGVRMPELQAPLATVTGWNLRDPKIGAPRELFGLGGSWIPFPRRAADRQRARDPRRAIEERYASRQDYLTAIESAARTLARDRYVLERDVPAIVERAAAKWDFLMKP